MSHKREIGFVLNGVRTRATVPVEMSTLAMLRDVIGITGTKYACGEGECGACTVIVDGVSICSCLMFAVDCDERELTTIEGLARDPLGQKLEQAFVEAGAVQCGFCTPGYGRPGQELARDASARVACRDRAGHRRQPLPLHRLREDRRRDRRGGRPRAMRRSR